MARLLRFGYSEGVLGSHMNEVSVVFVIPREFLRNACQFFFMFAGAAFRVPTASIPSPEKFPLGTKFGT